jgi:hypothetical protein
MKKITLLIIMAVLVSCRGKEETTVTTIETRVDSVAKPKPEPKVNLVIIPGQSIGNVSLEQNSEELEFLGPADLSDAAMGKAWLTWFSTNSKQPSGKTELNVYTTYKDNDLKQKVVRQIRITSPDFKTPEGISVGMSFSEIQKLSPDLDYIGNFRNPGKSNLVELYDSANIGIAYEIENTGSEKTCIAIIVHTKDRNVTEEYVTFHPDLVRE